MPLNKQKQKSADDTYYFSKSIVLKCEKILRIDGLWIIATLLFSGFIFLLRKAICSDPQGSGQVLWMSTDILDSTNRPRIDLKLLKKSQKTATNLI